MIYTGVGARKTPDKILDIMYDVGQTLADLNYTLRSGGAEGADQEFEAGCDSAKGKKEIYLPWKGFEDNDSPLYNISPEAYEIAEEVYGARWRNIGVGTMKLMARNMYQVMGLTLDIPSDFVVCWTPDGATTKRTDKSGGTGQAIAYANMNSIPVFNLKNNNDIDRLMKYIDTIGVMEW
jgi:hypothetical protein